MTDDTVTPVDIDTNDLDTFETEFFNPEAKEPDEVEESDDKVEESEVDENEDDSLATEDDDDEASEEDDEEDEEELEEDPIEEPVAKKRNRVQERIEQLLERERLANDRAHAAELKIAQLEAGKEVKKEEPKLSREALPEGAPNPDAKDADGKPVYPLGEFDPTFIRDITKFTIAQQMKEAEEKRQAEAEQKEIEDIRKELQDTWITKLDDAEKELPDIRENLKDLTETFQELEPAYGEYLATTLMSCEFGPQIMYYLSQNIGEAQKIVASGPVAATLAIGHLEAKFTPSIKQEEQKRNKKVSEAGEPPEGRTRGQGGRFSVPDDTDDLDAFEKKFFKG